MTRSWNNIGIECERVHEDVRMDIIEKIDKDEKFCLEEYQADIRTDSWFSSTLNSLHQIQCISSSSKVLIWEVESSIKLGMFDRLKMMYVVQSSNRVMRTPFLFSASILFSAHHSNSILDFYFFLSCVHKKWVIQYGSYWMLQYS